MRKGYGLNAQQDKRVLLTPVKDARAVNVFVDLKEDIPYDISIVDAKGYTVWTQSCDESVFARSRVLCNSSMQHTLLWGSG